MRRRVTLMTVVILLTMFTSVWAQKITVANVFAPNQATLDYLTTFNVSLEEPDEPFYARVATTPSVIKELQAAGFEVDILYDDLQAFLQEKSNYLNSLPKENPQDVTLDHYLTYAELTTFLSDLETAYSDIMSVEIIGQTAGTPSYDLYLVKISDNVETNENEPALFFENSIHGDEIAGYSLGLHTIEWLVSNYDVDPDITELIDSREIYMVPLTNPYGNQSPRTRYNYNGVDMNRNNGYFWNSGATYGSAMHSEPETQALADIWCGNQPFMFGSSTHSGTVVISLSWSYSTDEPLDWDEHDYLGEQYAYPQHCLDPNMDTWYQGSIGMYQMHGSTKDEMYGSHGMIAWSIELTYTKECSWSTTADVLTDHEPAIEWLLDEMSNGLHGTVTDADTSDPIAATIEVNGKWSTFTDYEVGDFHKYLRPGEYNVRVFANGYDDYATTVTIVDGTPTNLDVELEASDTPKTFAWRWLFSQSPIDEDSHLYTIDCLGKPDGEFYSLGSNGYAVLDMGPDGIENVAGDDIAVFEGYTDGDETFSLYGSTGDYFGPWTLIGTGTGTASFDIGAADFTNVRYVKVVSTSSSGTGQYKGYDFDAIGTPTLFAGFSADVTSGDAPLAVNFTDASGGNPTSWSWTFGDGGTSTDQNPSHTYTDYGEYDVTLEISNGVDSDTLVRYDYIQVVEPVPVAEFTGAPTSGDVPLEVTFTNQTTGAVTTWAWTLGDGDTSNEENPVHTYSSPGNYTVKLVATGPSGEDTRTRFNYISVACPAPEADFEADVTSGAAPLTVNFTNLTETVGSCDASYVWTFGDGGTSTDENPSHEYTAPGTYTVLLTAANSGGSDNEQKQGYVTVTGDDDDDDTTDDDTGTDDDDVTDDDDATDDDQNDDDVTDDDNTDGSDDDDDDDDDGCGC